MYVSGQYIKYPHVDRDTYGISPFSSWSGTGTQLYHNQIDQATSTTLVAGGGAVIGAAIGGLLGVAVGGAYGGVVGGVVGAVITAALTGFGLVYFEDEYNCIWWMIGKTFVQWLFTYAYIIYQLFLMSPLIAQSFVAGAFASGGYFRVGTATLWDAIGAGNP
ncbi:MAG: hypothetical protein QCH99_04815 [Candidatus Bathyarchaeota archaeon]|nr:hypothetical protein [Candidatus Bathyarchaeum tardum]